MVVLRTVNLTRLGIIYFFKFFLNQNLCVGEMMNLKNNIIDSKGNEVRTTVYSLINYHIYKANISTSLTLLTHLTDQKYQCY